MTGMLRDRRRVMASLLLAAGVQTAARAAPDLGQAAAPRDGHARGIWEFGAIGDGRADDSAAFERALATLPAGSELRLHGGRSYRLTRSLVFARPLVVTGGTKEGTRLLFDAGSYARLGDGTAALILPHERSQGFARGATARRTSLCGFTVQWTGQAEGGMPHGILIAAPAYLDQVDVAGFPGDGIRVEATSARVAGNANGSTLINCSALGNGRDGVSFHGEDANACLILATRSFDNRGAGFRDASLIGNSYVAAEVDGNRGGGFVSDKSGPNRSLFLGCYAEPDQVYDLNNRNLVVGPLGHVNGVAPVLLRAMPSGDLFSASAHVFAGDENAAAAMDGAFLRIGRDGVDLRHEDGQRVRLAKLLSSNYVDLLNGDDPVIRLPAGTVAGNIAPSRAWVPAGLSIGASGRSALVGAGAGPPTDGQHAAGALWLNDAPRVGGFVGWVCVADGAPGTWRPFGRIE